METMEFEKAASQRSTCSQCLGTGFDFNCIGSEITESRACPHCESGTIPTNPMIARMYREIQRLSHENVELHAKLRHFLYR